MQLLEFISLGGVVFSPLDSNLMFVTTSEVTHLANAANLAGGLSSVAACDPEPTLVGAHALTFSEMGVSDPAALKLCPVCAAATSTTLFSERRHQGYVASYTFDALASLRSKVTDVVPSGPPSDALEAYEQLLRMDSAMSELMSESWNADSSFQVSGLSAFEDAGWLDEFDRLEASYMQTLGSTGRSLDKARLERSLAFPSEGSSLVYAPSGRYADLLRFFYRFRSREDLLLVPSGLLWRLGDDACDQADVSGLPDAALEAAAVLFDVSSVYFSLEAALSAALTL